MPVDLKHGLQPINDDQFYAPDNVATATPAFIRSQIDPSKIEYVKGDPNSDAVSEVNSGSTTRIQVNQPKNFDVNSAAHEQTHLYQNAVNPYWKQVLGIGPQINRVGGGQNKGNADQTYDYGGVAGLENMLKNHQTIANMTDEVQAQIVGDYQSATRALQQKLAQGKATQADLEMYDRMQKAYHPFLQQMANMGAKGINIVPARPGPPPAAATHMMVPDPLLGGKAAYSPAYFKQMMKPGR